MPEFIVAHFAVWLDSFLAEEIKYLENVNY